jgi:hypothetical protein
MIIRDRDQVAPLSAEVRIATANVAYVAATE